MLPKPIENILDNPRNIKIVSIISLWEIVIKFCVKRLSLNLDYDQLVEVIKKKKFKLLPIKDAHLRENLLLPMLHGDPFDRLLIAQSRVEKISFISSDRNIKLYDVDLIWDIK